MTTPAIDQIQSATATPVAVPSGTLPEDGTLKFSKDFHIKEWESLREEVASQIDHTRKLELVTVAGLGAFYAWFESLQAKTPTQTPTHFLLLVPSLLVLLAGLRAWGTLVRIKEIATYIRTIERNFSLTRATGKEGEPYDPNKDLIGWDNTRDKLFPKSSPFKFSAALFWLAALVVSVLAWFYL